MFKSLLVTAVCCAVAMTITTQAATIKYTLKYDNVNIDEILSNDRLVNNYFKCIVDEGKCTPEGEEIKRWLPDAIETKCEGCSEKQKLGAEKIIKFLIEKKSSMWKQLEEKYDPQGVYRQRYSDLLNKLNNSNA